jgi:hypothetical protein
MLQLSADHLIRLSALSLVFRQDEDRADTEGHDQGAEAVACLPPCAIKVAMPAGSIRTSMSAKARPIATPMVA